MTTRSLKTRVATVLCSHRITPYVTTGVSPAELLLGKRLRTRLDLLKPNTTSHVEGKQLRNLTPTAAQLNIASSGLVGRYMSVTMVKDSCGYLEKW